MKTVQVQTCFWTLNLVLGSFKVALTRPFAGYATSERVTTAHKSSRYSAEFQIGCYLSCHIFLTLFTCSCVTSWVGNFAASYCNFPSLTLISHFPNLISVVLISTHRGQHRLIRLWFWERVVTISPDVMLLAGNWKGKISTGLFSRVRQQGSISRLEVEKLSYTILQNDYL